MRLERADTVIFLDYPRWRCFRQIMKRLRRHRGQTRPDMGPECAERWDWDFMKFVWGFKKRGRIRNYRMIREQGMLEKTVVLEGPREIKGFIMQIRENNKLI